MSNSIGLYIHIPFCKSKCPYCDFYSMPANEQVYDEYTATLCDKIIYWSKSVKENISTIYFGGGTPSILGETRLNKILDTIKTYFYLEKDAEITVEINPESGKSFNFKTLKDNGFNRISVGLQSANENELQLLGRIHTANEAKITVERARNAGIDNISLDLMMGIPLQTLDSLKKSIDFCNECQVTHISSYILKIEKGTKFDTIKDKLNLLDDDYQAELYLNAVDYLDSLGYEQYEISNFAKKSYQSRHNTNYWKCKEYIGIGPSAHSFYQGKRFYYDRDLSKFKTAEPIFDCYGGDKEEFIMLSLRLKSGLNFKEYENRYFEPLPSRTIEKIKKYSKMGYMEIDDNKACFTPKGYLVSNLILSELI